MCVCYIDIMALNHSKITDRRLTNGLY